ncbi:hypothetical protein F66182_6202 [Fusarium sp. NRRL 66182]|nr:hypothetical protein F66182_6202 [Fusarium sp. NRRL 66182]
MPKAPPPPPPPGRENSWRANPYGTWLSPSHRYQTPSASLPPLSRSATPNFAPNGENLPRREPPRGPASSLAISRNNPSGSIFDIFMDPLRGSSTSSRRNASPHIPRGIRNQKTTTSGREQGEITETPTSNAQASIDAIIKANDNNKPKRGLTMVDSMVLQAVTQIRGDNRTPGLSIHSNSRGGGIQYNIFTKVPNLSKTIAFNVESEEALLEAYRHVKAMNPSAMVGGIMFSVTPKTGRPAVEVADVSWGALEGRGRANFGRSFSINGNRFNFF